MTILGSSHFDLHADNGPIVIRLAAAMMVVSFLAVSCRLVVRRMLKQSLQSDDWFTLAALFITWLMCLIHIVAVRIGNFGRHIELATPQQIEKFLICLYIVQLTYILSIAMVKFAIIEFYRRLFKVASTRIPLWILFGMVAVWIVGTILPGIFSCAPVRGFWDKSTDPKCIDTLHYYLGIAIPNIITDVLLIVFPMPILWNLQITRTHKIALSGIFLIGTFIVLISCLRLVTVVQANNDLDATWSLFPLGVFNIIETNIAILCACLPSLGPLLRVILGKTMISTATPAYSESKKITERQYWPKKKGDTSVVERTPSLTWLNDPSAQNTKVIAPQTSVYGPMSDDIEMSPGRYTRSPGIRVEREIVWT